MSEFDISGTLRRFSSPRTFFLFDFVPSFSRLLIRSYEPSANPKCVDILFQGVGYVGLGKMMDGITIDRFDMPPDELEGRAQVGLDQYFYRVQSRGYGGFAYEGYVIADLCRTFGENCGYGDRGFLLSG